MTQPDFLEHRLFNQRIAPASCRSAVEAVSALCTMQAQDYLGGLWSVGLRVPGSSEADIERTIAERRIVRTWPMRGTLHFVAAEDVRWLLDLTAPRGMVRAVGRHRELELDAATFTMARKMLTRALQGGKILTRPAIFTLLEKAKISPKGQRGIHILLQLAQEGLICFGPREGKQPTFTLLEEWLPPAPSLERETALAKIALRYFSGHGPAPLNDFAGWSGLKLSDARAGLDAVSSELVSEVIDGETYWMPRKALPKAKPSNVLHLLPGFDEYLLGYKDRSAPLAPEHSQKIIPGGNGMFMPTILLHGRVVGTWKRELEKDSVKIIPHFFTNPKKSALRAFKEAAMRYANFLGKNLELS